jgi:predicted transcriptional regulator
MSIAPMRMKLVVFVRPKLCDRDWTTNSSVVIDGGGRPLRFYSLPHKMLCGVPLSTSIQHQYEEAQVPVRCRCSSLRSLGYRIHIVNHSRLQ